jgi:DNA-binding NarL/FixJ family response regulator
MTDIRNKPPPALTSFGPPAPRKPLTAVQEEIARLLATGADLDEIASEQGMHVTTVKYHITQTARALNMRDCEDLTDREQVLVWAFWTYRQGAA